MHDPHLPSRRTRPEIAVHPVTTTARPTAARQREGGRAGAAVLVPASDRAAGAVTASGQPAQPVGCRCACDC